MPPVLRDWNGDNEKEFISNIMMIIIKRNGALNALCHHACTEAFRVVAVGFRCLGLVTPVRLPAENNKRSL